MSSMVNENAQAVCGEAGPQVSLTIVWLVPHGLTLLDLVSLTIV